MPPFVYLRQYWLPRLVRRFVPEAGVINLNRRRVYIFPTYAGFFFALTLLLMYLGSVNYKLALGHALVFFLAGLGLTGMLYTYRNLLGLIVNPLENDPAYAGEDACFRLLVKNSRSFSRDALEWHIEGSPKNQVQHLEPLSEKVLCLFMEAPVRGWLVLPPLKVASRYPVGFFLTWAWLCPQSRCLVYPRPVFTPLLCSTEPDEVSDALLNQEGHEDFAGFRDYQPSDSLRHAAWKIDARHDGQKPLLVKLFCGNEGKSLRFSLAEASGSLEERISTLAGWVIMAEKAGLRYGLHLPDVSIASLHGPAHQHECLKALALYSGGL